VIVREVCAGKAHVAPHGTTQERFDEAAKSANATRKVHVKLTWKSIQDRYKRLQSRYDAADRVDQRMSGAGGELRELRSC